MKNTNWRKCLIVGDSRDVLKRIPDNSIDLILTDPPYNLGKHSTGNIPLPGRNAMNNDIAEWDMVDFNPEEWADEFIRILKPTGNLFIFTSYNQLGRWYNCLDHKFDTTNFMIWHKTNPAPKIFKAGFLNSCEMIFTCWNKKHTWNFISQAQMHNFIESSICMRPERLTNPKHPAQKPVAILKKMIEIASNEGDIIFDPFMGVGSTGVAAIDLGRKFIGVELQEDYYIAAKKRIDNAVSENIFTMESANKCADAEEPQGAYTLNWSEDLETIFPIARKKKKNEKITKFVPLAPLVKWPGGKEKELKYILPNLPECFDRYIEPFVGGGSVFMAVDAPRLLVNDLSSDLMTLYKNISENNSTFYSYCEGIDSSLAQSDRFFADNRALVDYYLDYRNSKVDSVKLRKLIKDFCAEKIDSIVGLLSKDFSSVPCILQREMEKNLSRKMLRMHEIEISKHELPEKDICDNIVAAIRSALYMNYRNLYNNTGLSVTNPELYSALFLYIRNYAYSGMFRFSSKGDFNVPYGGIAYNSKFLTKKLAYYRSEDVLRHFGHTQLYNLDFETFFKEIEPTDRDFIFLDPPYDSDFSTYDKNPFGRADQERLAQYLIRQCKAKWMLVIKNTEFINGLYDKKGIKIRAFDKEYLVSFMNRNDKKTEHLLITNY